MKTNRLALIAALCGSNPAPLNAAPSEVSEEVNLAKSHNDDASILDESANVELISPLLADRIESVNDKMGAESLDLTPAERAEVGALVRFVKVAVVESDESPVPQDLDYEGLAKWADEVSGLFPVLEVAAI